ncbi:MAG: hypothetical protein MJ131_02525 [Lachnospiraceae bacterium]|nr:hypothetical protein [Lachnospiraceae bacterium]
MVYFVFSWLGKFIVNVILNRNGMIGEALAGNYTMVLIIRALISGSTLFLGIIFSFRLIMKQYVDKEAGLVFGLGVGGMQCYLEGMLISLYKVSIVNTINGFCDPATGTPTVSYISSVIAESGAEVTEDTATDMFTYLNEYLTTFKYTFDKSIVIKLAVEIILMFFALVAICIIVYYAIKKRNAKVSLLGLILCISVYLPSLSTDVNSLELSIENVSQYWLNTIILFVLAAAAIYLARNIYKRYASLTETDSIFDLLKVNNNAKSVL